MADPVSLQFDGRLTDVAIQYRNPDYVADLVVPVQTSSKKQSKYKKYSKPERFTLPPSLVGPDSEPNEVNFVVTEDSFTCEDHGYQKFLSQEDIDNADAPITPESDTVDFVMNLLMLKKEKDVADFVFNASNYAAANQLDVAGGWTTLSTDALSQIQTAIRTCFVPPNLMVMGEETWNKLCRNTTILDAMKGSLNPRLAQSAGLARTPINQAEFASFLGLDAVIVGKAKYNTAKPGQTESYSQVWDGTNIGKGGAALLRVKAGGATRDVVWGANFHWKQRQVLRFPATRGAFGGQMIRVVESRVLKSIATDVGYLFVDALVT